MGEAFLDPFEYLQCALSVSRAVLHFRWRGHTPWPTLGFFCGLLVIFRHGVWVEV
jgi:hypothetical protein